MKKSNLVGLPEQYRALIGSPGLMHQVFDTHPSPIQIFAPDGTTIFINRAHMELHNIKDANLVVGKYNYNYDPVCLEIFGQDFFDGLLRGEAASFPDFPTPIQDVKDRGVIEDKPYQALTMDLFFQPIWDGDTYVCMIMHYNVKNRYEGRADVGRAKAYIREHWREKFDLDAIAKAAGRTGGRQLHRMFKEVTGLTPFEYYRKVKLEKIQEKLMDSSLSVAEAFAACGVDSHGVYFRLFKEKTGMSPNEFRKGKLKN